MSAVNTSVLRFEVEYSGGDNVRNLTETRKVSNEVAAATPIKQKQSF